MFTYIFDNKSYENTDIKFMKSLGMSDEQIESVKAQEGFMLKNDNRTTA